MTLKGIIALAIVVGLLVILFLRHYANDEIRTLVEQKIADHYDSLQRGLKVSIRSAELVQGKGVRIQDLTILDPKPDGTRPVLLYVEECQVTCTTDWAKLLQGQFDIRCIKVRRPKLHASQSDNGHWDVGKLLPPPRLDDHTPDVIIEDGIVEIIDPQKKTSKSLVLREVNLSVLPNTTAKVASTNANHENDLRTVDGSCVADGIQSVQFKGQMDLKTGVFSFLGQADGIDISPELHDAMPGLWAAKLQKLGGLRGQGSVKFEAAYDPNATVPLKYKAAGRLTRGRLDDSRLPRALTDIRASFRLDNSGWAIDDFSGHCGEGTVRMSCRQAGFDSTSPLSLSAELRQLNLDGALLEILPPSLQDQWSRYRPKGEVDADIQLTYDGRQWNPQINARCLDVSFCHHKFPYRLEHCKGTIDIKEGRLDLNLLAMSGRQEVTLTARITDLFSAPVGWFEFKGNNIEIDESLLVALPEKSQPVVRSLNPHGVVNVFFRLNREKPDEPMHPYLHIAANRCSILYDKFKYAISDIRGVIEMRDNYWQFSNFEGTHDNAVVTCNGSLAPTLEGSAASNKLSLHFVGKDVPLGPSLRDALPENVQQVWRDVRPEGAIDLTADVDYLTEERKFSVGVEVKSQSETASINPILFPYRLERLQGNLVYKDGHATFKIQKAQHGDVTVQSEGYCDFSPDGRFEIHLVDLSADRLIGLDRDLAQALPERLRKAILEINPTGSINLHGNLDFERTGMPNEPLHAAWNVRLGLQQTNIQCGGLALENIHGTLQLRGDCDGRTMQSRGELNLDSLNYKDCQFTRITGPIWIDDGRVLFGMCVDQPDSGSRYTAGTGSIQPARKLTAKVFGGNFYLDGWVITVGEPRYKMLATLTEADLAQCVRDLAPGRRDLRGKLLVTADLSGSGYTRNQLSGNGTIQMTDADVYQLPLMISLLKILSIRPPDQNAFSSINLKYKIQGEHIYLDPIDFQGDAISLHGNGELDFQSNIRQMSLYASVGRGELDLPLVKEVFRSASQQIMLIHVDGNLQNPNITREALPGVNQAVQQFFGENQNRRQ